MTNCKYITKNGRCGLKGSYAYRHRCFGEDMCRCREPMTNADHIRAMTDEELAAPLVYWLDDWGEYDTPIGRIESYEEAIAKTIDWLKQPYGGEDHA